ncbi:glutamate--cysteine ligase [Roseospira marina]|uniref:Glutamate--cysteine ligase n=1 Tax=Roseospira marina TaxID=140057 RepID=A0A5M6IB98_9PROT|nr:glutamate--cysteine ligase [Roseospira marina]KAA5605015.1 glutamate--cysteine ligase [Roseospira marina]MBB4314974.1 glutamate--cysteine ligase [Roseospira marina]MBB5087974.1 glutamate--cysteine ligase [Roseospira marina]
MSAPAQANAQPIEGKADLVAWFESGCKPAERWRIGTEHEKLAFSARDFRPLPYERDAQGPGIRDLLERLEAFGWAPVEEAGKLIALSCPTGGSVTLEPGGQLELSGAPLTTIHETCAETTGHHLNLKAVCAELGIGLIGLGFNPKWPRETVSWMPKGRYDIMRRYMPTKGSLGLDMMLRTCTVQVNLDFSSEADMVRKFRAGIALQPLATALWANSPFTEGKPNGFLSYRSHIWTDTDPDRCGIPAFVFEPGMGFERYVDYMLDVPMYFVYRDGRYIDVAGQSFRDFMDGRLPGRPGERPTLGDWADHVTTAFPEVRLKTFLEMRGADGGPWSRICALPAFWVGLLYDGQALDAVSQLIRDWTPEDIAALRDQVPAHGLRTPFKGRTLGNLALEVLTIARGGLARRARLNTLGRDETCFLDVLFTIAESGRSPAEDHLEAFHGRWNGSVDPIFIECAY